MKISVIVPVYNVENYLRPCLDSLIGQTLKEIEIICIDDASHDGSARILEEYQQKDTRIKVIAFTENQGTLSARIRGVEEASGKYFLFVDSDDFLENTACEELYNLIEQKNVDVVHFGTVLHASPGVSVEMKEWVDNFLTPFTGNITGKSLVDACFVEENFDFNITNKIWKRDVCRIAFSKIQQKKLVASEDRYIFFVLAFFSEKYFGTEKKYYHYNLGVGVTGGDILALSQFEKRCSGSQATRLVHDFLKGEGKEHEYQKAEQEFAHKILWDCVDCWYNKLKKSDEVAGFAILQKYFAADEIVSAFARVYFEKTDKIEKKANLGNNRRVAIYYRYLGYDRMDTVILENIKKWKLRGFKVFLYTDEDRKKYIKNIERYGVKVSFLVNSIDANWDKYEKRAVAFYQILKADKIDLLVYASPSSHICELDIMLAILSGISIVDIKDEVYLEKLEEEISEFESEIGSLKSKIEKYEKQLASPRILWKMFWTSLKMRIGKKHGFNA